MRDASEELLAVIHLFDKETATAKLLRRRRLELWPVLAEQTLGPAADKANIEAARHLYATDPDLRQHPLGPLLWYLLHRLFLAAAAGGSNLAEAHRAAARVLSARNNDATPLAAGNWPMFKVMWALPDLAKEIVSAPIGVDNPAERGRFVDHLCCGLDLLRKTCPALCERLTLEVRWFVPLFEAESGGRHSMTVAQLPGVLFIGARSGSNLAAELIIHEYLHTVLHGVSETKPLIEAMTAERPLYSPWREDARPAEALLHAVYVFTGVLLFWLYYVGADAEIGREAEDRVAILRLQLAPSVEALRASGRGEVLDRVAAAAERAIALAAEAPIPRGAAEHALARTEAHRRRWLKTVAKA
jgi:hypothetical protein